MRNRSNSGVRLDYFQRLVNKTILKHQNPVTGLFPASDFNNHAWVRDNVYSVLAVWGLSLAYRKTADLDEDLAKAYELEQAVVKLMRGLLRSMMLQGEKLEKFKHTQNPNDSLHAKYSSKTGKSVVGDDKWGHLQIDATSIYLLFLAQMTASGLEIIYTLDEVAFIQNLVFYIETAYRTPDYGIWERGDKTNHGLPELNSSSIGMAKAALEAMNEVDLFGARGGPASVIHALPDEARQCQAILHSMLPRESSSKEVDAALITVISFPAFAVDDVEIINRTRDEIEYKLMGRYGCRRFLRDGYHTSIEDPNRLHYEPWELQMFENIECHWPMFLAYFILDGLYCRDEERVTKYKKMLDDVLVKGEDGTPLIPEMYMVPRDKVDAEVKHPNSQKREYIGKLPQMWGQSLYILGRLIEEDFMSGQLMSQTSQKREYMGKLPQMWGQSLYILGRLIEEIGRVHCLVCGNWLKGTGFYVRTSYVTAQSEERVYGKVASNVGTVIVYTGSIDRRGQLISQPSQKREYMGKLPQMWGQSLYILGRLIEENFISPGELDPLNRRLVMEPKPDVVVQVVILAEDVIIQSKLEQHGIYVQTLSEVNPIRVYPARSLSQIYSLLGINKKMGLTGRPSHEIGLLATSKLYMLHDQILAFIPQFVDKHKFYLPLDVDFLVDTMKNNMDDLARNWRMMGRPTFICPINGAMLDQNQEPPSSLIGTIKKLQSGYIAGTRVHLGNLSDFVSTSCVTKLSFLENVADLDSDVDKQILDIFGDVLQLSVARPRLLSYGKKKSRVYRNSSIKGIVRRSRSITVDADDIPVDATGHLTPDLNLGHLEGLDIPSPNHHHHHHLRDSPIASPSTSPTGSPVTQRKLFGFGDKHFQQHETTYENINIHEIVDQLSSSENLVEQADIIHYLFMKKGADWDTEVDGKSCTVQELLVELYEKAGHYKQWWLVRHAAGMLKKRVEDLALAATDLLVRQKQLSVGLPPDRERIVTRPLPPDELSTIIYEACGEDLSTAALTQEILIYLAMFIRTEPKLFNEMLRLRVGLIIQVMASELSRTFKCSGEEASDHLLNLSPYELKTMLHHILSGKEFVIQTEATPTPTPGSPVADKKLNQMRRRMSTMVPGIAITPTSAASSTREIFTEDAEDRQGQWLRRRRLDGALNRVPVGFYPQVWKVLEKSQGLSLGPHYLPQSLTREMTSGEFKFALQVERVLNMIPQPEYRQLLVEALMVTTLLVESDCRVDLRGKVIHIDKIVHEANAIFIQEQKIPDDVVADSLGAAGICLHLYDLAPSGRLGTMSYFCRALAKILDFGDSHNMECTLS